MGLRSRTSSLWVTGKAPCHVGSLLGLLLTCTLPHTAAYPYIPDRSMDYNEAFRDMGHICVISEEGIKRYAEDDAEGDAGGGDGA